QMGSEGPQWWHDWPDHVRHLPTGGILDRCRASGTCPKIVETFGGAEVFALKMTTSWVGTDPETDIPLPHNVRRYYLPSSTHGRGERDEHGESRATLVEATKKAMGFPSGIPRIPDSIFRPENFVFPVFDYNWGPEFDHFNATGVPTNAPPPIRHVIKMLVPRVD